MREVVIAGGSMSPTLEVGEVALVEPAARVRCGDVIVFSTERGDPICHRAVLVVPGPGPRRIVHLGDAEGAGFGIVGSRSVIGRVTSARSARGVEREIGRRRPDLCTAARAVVHLLRAAMRGWAGRRARAA